jgi:CRP-like cAMP-binding protein
MVDDGERLITKLGPGDNVGILSVICDRPRSATARASKSTTLLFTTAEDVSALLEHNPSVANAMLRYVGQRFAETLEQEFAFAG